MNFLKPLRKWLLMAIDGSLVIFCGILALELRFDFRMSSEALMYQYILNHYLPVLVLLTILVGAVIGLYKSLWRYASISELMVVTSAALWANLIFYLVVRFTGGVLPRSFYFINAFLQMAAMGGVRFSYRVLRRLQYQGLYDFFKRKKSPANYKKRVIIIGAGSGGVLTAREYLTADALKFDVVGFLDDDRNKIGRTIMGIEVLGRIAEAQNWVEKLEADVVLIAMPSVSKKRRKEIYDMCRECGAELKTLPGLYEIIDGRVDVSQIRPVEIEDLLGRDPITLDNSHLNSDLNDKVVLVTGAGGSIGSELCRQIAYFKPKRLIMFDIYENTTYDIQNELRKRYPELNLTVLIGSVRDRVRLDRVFCKYRPEMVFHAAAHKHVPLMQDSPLESIKNNTFGTRNVAEFSGRYGVKRFLLISTDKAVNPTNIMGASKRLAELAVLSLNLQYPETDFVAVRFGNVLGSNGSVVPLFKKQIAEGGPITVTDPNIIRYFMTIPEAVQLVLKAGTMAKGGEIFVLDMGEPVKILTLAEDLIRLSGLEPYQDIDIVFSGLRPGEKLYEELLLAEEGTSKTDQAQIFIGKPNHVEADDVENVLEGLREALEKDDLDLLEKNILTLIPTYRIISREIALEA